MISKRDLQLGKIAMRAGMVTKDQITRCLALKKKLAETKGKDVALGALLLKKGYITQEQLEEIVRLHNEKGGSADGEARGRSGRRKRAKRASSAGEASGETSGEAATATASAEAGATDPADAAGDDEAAERARAKKARAKKARAKKAREGADPDAPAGERARRGANGAQPAARSSRRAAPEASGEASKPEEASDAGAVESAEGTVESTSHSDADPALFASAPEGATDDEDRRLIACPDCGKQYRVREKQTGKRFACRRCKSRVKVPKDLFSRPIEAAPKAKGKPKSRADVEVEEFTLSSSEQAPDDEEAGPTPSVRAAAAQAAAAIKKVQAQTSIADLARAATQQQKKGLPPRTKFGPRQAATLLVSVLGLVGVVGGALWARERSRLEAEAAAQALADRELGAWRQSLEGAVAKAEGALAKRSPIEIGTALADLRLVLGERAALSRRDNQARSQAELVARKVDELARTLLLARADAYAAEGGLRGAEEAIVALAEAVRETPDDEALTVRLGRRLIAAHRHEEAAKALERLAERSAAARCLRGLALERGDDGPRAAEEYAKVEHPLAPVLVARAHVADRAWAAALTALGGASGLDARGKAAGKVIEALAHEGKGDLRAADAAYVEAGAEVADVPEPRIARGEFLLRQGRVDEAVVELERAKTIGGTARGLLALGDAYAAQLETDRARAVYRDATALPAMVEAGDATAPGGVDPFEAPFQSDARALARVRLGALEAGAGRVGPAREQLGQAQQLDPFVVEAEVLLAELDLREANLPLADSRLARVELLLRRLEGPGRAPEQRGAELVRAPVAAQALVVRAAHLHAAGRFQEALDRVARAEQVDPAVSAAANALRGRLFEALNQHERAYEAFARAAALEVEPTSPAGRAYVGARKALDEAGAGGVGKALAGVEAALSFNPYHASAQLLRARALVLDGRASLAVPALEAAIGLNGYLRDAFVARGFLHVRDLPEQERTREAATRALGDFQFALRVEAKQGGERAETHYGLALVHFLLNDLRAALDAANRCLELDEKFTEGWGLRARIKERQGDRAGASADAAQHKALAGG